MKYQPKIGYISNDVVQTPPDLAKKIVSYFSPRGKILEPCRGKGNFFRFLPCAEWCEISKGRDFMQYNNHVNWIVTNPPWSKITDFLKHSLDVSDNVVFLLTLNHLWTEARIRAIKERGCGIKTIICLKWPPKSSGFPRSGFQLGVVHIKKGWKGGIKFATID